MPCDRAFLHLGAVDHASLVHPQAFGAAGGAAIGVIGAASAAAYYGQPPEEGLCWYYTNPSRTAGFWDVCPY